MWNYKTVKNDDFSRAKFILKSNIPESLSLPQEDLEQLELDLELELLKQPEEQHRSVRMNISTIYIFFIRKIQTAHSQHILFVLLFSKSLENRNNL